MHDRPNAGELIEAALLHIEENVLPAVRDDRKLYFQTLAAANALRMVRREMALAREHLYAEWNRLNALEGDDTPMPLEPGKLRIELARRNRRLCADIGAGKYDHHAQHDLIDHLKASTREQLEVANPAFLHALAAESSTES